MDVADVDFIKGTLIAIMCFTFSIDILLWGVRKELQEIAWTLQQIKRKIESLEVESE